MNHADARAHRGNGGRPPTDPDLIDRLARLRSILPLIATDLAAARRRANDLEARNRKLAARVAELESKLTSTLLDKRSSPARSRQRPTPAGRKGAGPASVAHDGANRSESREAREGAGAGIRSPLA
jgi:hypothetical protein